MPSNYVKRTGALKPITTWTTYQHRTKIVLRKPPAGLTKSQKLKQLRVGTFTVTKQITDTTYKIRGDASPDNVKTTHRNHLIEYFSKDERLPPPITN